MTSHPSRLVLLVEDEPAIADTLIYALRTESFPVVWLRTGGEALNQYKSLDPCLILLDIGLPDMNGFEVCRRMRRASDVPIVFLTARTGEVDRVVGLEIGADDYVVKPFSPREVCARVRAILRRGRPAADKPPQTAPGFEIHEAGMCIRYDGRKLDLARYEYRLLKLLLDTPGHVYSREQLMQRLWENPEHSLDRTVDSHIRNLRAKLREVGAGDVIRTVRGVGYALNAAGR